VGLCCSQETLTSPGPSFLLPAPRVCCLASPLPSVSPPPRHPPTIPPHLCPSVVSSVSTRDPPCEQWLTGEGWVLAMLVVANLVLRLVLALAQSATEVEAKRKNAPMAQETLTSPGQSFLLPAPRVCRLTSPPVPSPTCRPPSSLS
jgi:hypothetical protein